MGRDLTLAELRILFLKGVGAVEEDGAAGQVMALEQLIKALQKIQIQAIDKARIEDARNTKGMRLSKEDQSWGVHMTHCFMPEDEWDIPCCKYGEDDICPAALYENPFMAFLDYEASKRG